MPQEKTFFGPAVLCFADSPRDSRVALSEAIVARANSTIQIFNSWIESLKCL